MERGPGGDKAWPIAHVLGGKNVFYFLTPLPGGRLQVMPLAYDTRQKEWFDSAGSMVRHFRSAEDAPVDWTDRALTFNTSCYACHVSQLDRGYSFETDTYRTTWGEPGINCEACHSRAGGTWRPPRRRRRRRPSPWRSPSRGPSATTRWTPCAPRAMRRGCRWTRASCRERDSSTTRPGGPGGPRLLPRRQGSGRELHLRPWLLSPCSSSGKLDCMHCHTSSGRNSTPAPRPTRPACPATRAT